MIKKRHGKQCYIKKKTIIFLILLLSQFCLFLFPLNIKGNIQNDLIDYKFEVLNDISSVSSDSDLKLSSIPEGGNWIPFVTGADPGELPIIQPKSRDTTGLCIDSKFYGMYNKTIYTNDTLYNFIDIPGGGHSWEVGAPSMPMITKFLEIPKDVDVNINILYNSSQIIENFNVIPTQEPIADLSNATLPAFQINDTIYSNDAFYPSQIAMVEGQYYAESIIIRGHRILVLTLYPVQFNPITHKVKTYSRIEVRIEYNQPAQIKPISTHLISTTFEPIFQTFILNANYSLTRDIKKNPPWIIEEGQEEGAEYLIITHDDFYNQVQPLEEWKERKGLKTKIVKTSEIDNVDLSSDDVSNFIQNAYDTWSPAPSYVLLVGDVDFIPAHYHTNHPYHNILTATDLNYGMVDGTDYFPDLYVGRLSVQTTNQASIFVNKILDYERNPPTDPNFYNQIAACAQFQDEDTMYTNRDGYEDRRFTLTSEEIRDHLVHEGYTVDRIYHARDPNPALPGGQDPTNYNNGDYDDGLALPADLWWPGFTWDGDTADISNAINNGRFLIYHRDHGESRNDGYAFDGWSHPEYRHSDIYGLTNGDLLPVVLSIECEAGWYDGETDAYTTRNFESFCEEFTREANGGAIAAVGASRVSYSGYNDYLAKGFIDAVWPSFDPNFASGGLFNLGQMLVYGKVYMSTFYGYSGSNTRLTFELFNLFSDPELSIWTAEPNNLDVSHPTEIGSNGLQQFAVYVEDADSNTPINHAKICLQKGSDIYEVTYSDSAGYAYFSINPSSGGNMNVTVTKQNYIPYTNMITVSGSGASLSVNPTIARGLEPVTLNGNNFVGNEDVDIDFDGTALVASASGGSFSIPTDVPTGAAGYINIIAVGRNSGRVGIARFHRVTNVSDIYTYCQGVASTWNLNPEGSGSDVNPRWDSPCIRLYEKSSGDLVSSNDLRVGTTYTIKTDFYNRRPGEAPGSVVTFTWTFIGAGQNNWYDIGIDTVTVPASGKVTAEIEWTPSITGHICLRSSISYLLDIDPSDNWSQENTNVKHVSSPGEISTTICNPTGNLVLVYLEARQLDRPDDIWPTTIIREFPQELNPGENQSIIFRVDPPSGVELNETRRFNINAYVKGRLIGGVEVIAVKDLIPPPIHGPSIYLLLIIALISSIYITIRLRKVKRREIEIL